MQAAMLAEAFPATELARLQRIKYPVMPSVRREEQYRHIAHIVARLTRRSPGQRRRQQA